jgi:hypothetical protein
MVRKITALVQANEVLSCAVVRCFPTLAHRLLGWHRNIEVAESTHSVNKRSHPSVAFVRSALSCIIPLGAGTLRECGSAMARNARFRVLRFAPSAYGQHCGMVSVEINGR